MADEQPTTVSRRRGRGAEATSRAEALERLKAVQRGGWRSEAGGGYVVKVDQPIYDTVAEEEYEKIVKRRREDAKGFIVDDNGLGYGDEGEEEDWTRHGLPESSSEEDGDDEIKNRTKRKEKKESDKDVEKKGTNPALSAAAAMMGKQRISAMFTSTMFKNKDCNSKIISADCESIVNDVIAEFAPDDADRERRRRVTGMPQLAKKCSGFVSPKVGTGRVAEKFDFSIKHSTNVAEKLDESKVLKDGAVEVRPDSPKLTTGEMEIKFESVETKENVRHAALNAKINTEVVDPAMSATAEWQAVRKIGCGGNIDQTEIMKREADSNELSEIKLNPDGSLPFFILDAHEESFGINAGTLYLFGKVSVGSTYHSCCVVLKNMQRCVYAVPKSSIFGTNAVFALEKDVEESKVSLTEYRKALQDMSHELKNEIARQLVAQNVSEFSMTPVKRKYAFERDDIPHGENYVMKINYPFKDPPLSVDLKGETFSALLGTHCTALELFLVKRRVKGPSWLSISNYSTCSTPQQVSWCKFEISVQSSKDISVSSSSKITLEIPPVVVAAINLKTLINEKQNVNEIVAASIICCRKAKIDGPMLASEWKKPGILSNFSVVRKLDGGVFPVGFNKEAADRNMKAGSNILGIESSERALLNRFMIELNKLDTDVIVGHNISGFDLDVLLHRVQACKVPSNTWSKIGRLKRSVMPKIKRVSSIFGSGASPGIMSCIAGRLLCDTYLCSRDLLKEVSYSLTQLAKSRLKHVRKEITPHDVPQMYQTSSTLMELIECGETDGWLSMELMFHLSILPLTRQLTNISGNLWNKTLQGARAQRVEYLLLHAFYTKKYMFPDKIHASALTAKVARKANNQDAGKDSPYEFEVEDSNLEGIDAHNDRGKSKRSPAYAGGLVLEPKKGLYDKIVLLLDFNSLYPSIIQEYNICFTTVEKPMDGQIPQLPSCQLAGVLPELLKNLVERRKMVKSMMKTASGIKLQQLDIQQQALKLTANSMYGCLGFSNSRFYAKPLAELITLQGREILQCTVDLVQNKLNLEVIYGDTDSIMIHSGVDDVEKAKNIARKVTQEVNKKYRCLEIDLDGLYARMLLLKKKKYAAVKMEFKDGKVVDIIERKGLDMVRRDWSLLSKEIGDYCLGQILSGGSCEEVVESIHNSLRKVQEEMRNGQIALEKYVITKSLTKPPEAYPDAKNQPHVLVALRRRQNGYTSGCSSGDTVPYIICYEQGVTSLGSSSGIAQRARHPDEIIKDDGKWLVDVDYYLSQQIHPVVARLCASIQGTSPERLADCLGLDSSKFQIKSSDADNDHRSGSLFHVIDDDERYKSCAPLVLSCPSCSTSFDCPSIFNSICKIQSSSAKSSMENFWVRMRCPNCPEEDETARISPMMLANQVKRQADGFIAAYYKGLMTCDDETCKHTTRCINLRVIGDFDRGTTCPNYPRCNGHLIRKFTEADLYNQLSYYCHVLDTVRCLEKLDVNARIPLERELAKVRPLVDLAFSTARQLRDRCGYGWVRLDNLAVTV